MAKKIFILAEHKKGALKKATTELLGASAGLEVSALLFGSGAEAAAADLAKKGVQNVFWVKDAKYDNYHPDAYAAVAEELIRKDAPAYVLASASSYGKDLLPKLAARFDAPLVADCTELKLEPELHLRRPFFSGKALANVIVNGAATIFVSLRPNSLVAGEVGSAAGKVTEVAGTYDFAASPMQFVTRTEAVSDRPDLTEASIIISGGRSLKTKENFKILFDLASTVNAAVGASRAAVDEGLATHDMQVGQTGKTVNPNLYIACGISGAIQHLAGMRTSKVIVAINKDAAAPIFTKANYGIVGDLFNVVPALTEEFKKLAHKA